MASVTLPDARPYAFEFVPERTALVLIDMQRDFLDPGGFGAIQCGDPEVFARVRSVIARTKPVLAAARTLGLHVIHTREGHQPSLSDLSAAKRDRQLHAPAKQVTQPDGTLTTQKQHTATIGDAGTMGRLLVRGENGHDIVDELKPLPNEVVVDKPGKGGFWATSLHRKLMARGITHLLFCGVTTECCVASTAREASDRGFQCCILEDCTSGFDKGFGKTTVDMYVSFDGLFGFASTSSSLVEHARQRRVSSAAAWNGDVDLKTLAACYKTGLSPIDVVNSVYSRIEAYEKVNPHAWILLRSRHDVLADARALEAKYASNDALPTLYGVPFAVKDSFDVAGLPTTAACPDFAYTPTKTAPSVTAILNAGGLLFGKTNMDQLATGLSGCRSPYGTSSSSHGPVGRYCAGGSSTGSAVAVGAKLVTFSLATDTAGSIRVPAAFNGIVGFKPTKGTMSYRGVVPCCRTLDTAAILAQSVEDARSIWYIVDEHDAEDAFAADPASLPLELADYRGLSQAGFTCALAPASEIEAASLSTQYKTAFAAALEVISQVGGSITTLDSKSYAPFKKATDLLYNGTLVNERIACIGYEFVRDNIARFHPTTRTLFQKVLDRDSKPWDVFSDKIAQAEATREVANLFSKESGGIDVLVVPTVPFHPTIEAMQADPIAMNAQLGVFTHFGNVLDLCAISVVAGYVDGASAGEAKMPFSVCFVCARGMDGLLFDIASAFERGVNRI
ncbi:glutamyl-trna amidotransferase subunit a [Ophiostoma piceae UAMH 11346]|uniref:Glutamyl-trna amidotransferase subunit a n=1 Tax=Ophiostoma piceae (strain UAMH 11346) TaxID=1262450 RepID=S3D7U4_OPHP1|nr:glutamyl-trna amidotransferase subunit a [Ophiostoma piceae UAMH 11346]